MLNEHTPSRESLDLITDTIIRETFLAGATGSAGGSVGGSLSINLKQESEPKENDHVVPIDVSSGGSFTAHFKPPNKALLKKL